MSDKRYGAAVDDGAVSPGWARARRIAGFGAAGTMALYLAVKVTWVVGALLGAAHLPETVDPNMAEWIALNVITIGMAVVGVVLGLALAQPWGKRLPAPLVIVFTWVASGFLVSLLPHSVLSALLSATGTASSGGSDPFPRWELALIMVGFVGMAVGLLVAVPIYMLERWPHAFRGRSGGADVASTRRLAIALAASAAVALLWTWWAAGGTFGLNPDALELWNLDARLLVGTSAAWAVVGAWSAWALSGRTRAHVPMWLPMTAGFVASGSLVAWNVWRALWLVIPLTEFQPMRSPAVAAIEHGTAVVAGLAIVVILLRAYRIRALGAGG